MILLLKPAHTRMEQRYSIQTHATMRMRVVQWRASPRLVVIAVMLRMPADFHQEVQQLKMSAAVVLLLALAF
jgi:hypothetical protein